MKGNNYHLKDEGAVIMTNDCTKAHQITSLLDSWSVPFYEENSYVYIPRENYDMVKSDLERLGHRGLKTSYN